MDDILDKAGLGHLKSQFSEFDVSEILYYATTTSELDILDRSIHGPTPKKLQQKFFFILTCSLGHSHPQKKIF